MCESHDGGELMQGNSARLPDKLDVVGGSRLEVGWVVVPSNRICVCLCVCVCMSMYVCYYSVYVSIG